MATNQTPTTGNNVEPRPAAHGGAVTIHHLDREAFDDREYKFVKDDIRIGRRDVDAEDVAELYRPVETIVGTTDLSEAYRHAQGEVVNAEQGGRHGVPSAHVTNVFEVIHPDGRREYHLVESIGFTEIGVKSEGEGDDEPKAAIEE